MVEFRVYEAERGFTIVAVRVRCGECQETMPSEASSVHKQMHRLEESRKRGSGTRQCMCTPGNLDPHCPRHGNYLRRR